MRNSDELLDQFFEEENGSGGVEPYHEMGEPAQEGERYYTSTGDQSNDPSIYANPGEVATPQHEDAGTYKGEYESADSQARTEEDRREGSPEGEKREGLPEGYQAGRYSGSYAPAPKRSRN